MTRGLSLGAEIGRSSGMGMRSGATGAGSVEVRALAEPPAVNEAEAGRAEVVARALTEPPRLIVEEGGGAWATRAAAAAIAACACA